MLNGFGICRELIFDFGYCSGYNIVLYIMVVPVRGGPHGHHKVLSASSNEARLCGQAQDSRLLVNTISYTRGEYAQASKFNILYVVSI